MISNLYQIIQSSYSRLRYPSVWNGFSIKSHLTSVERITLLRLTQRPSIQICLEIGSYLGASAYFISAGLLKKKCDVKLLCIDTWNNDAMSEGVWDTYSEFSKNTQPFSQFILPIRGFSTEVVEQVRLHTQRIDLLFIDGDHSYDAVKTDWETYKWFMKPGSIVVFHDWGWSEDVQRVIEEVKPVLNNYESLPNMWWGEVRA